jgi:hypothetical protein
LVQYLKEFQQKIIIRNEPKFVMNKPWWKSE